MRTADASPTFHSDRKDSFQVVYSAVRSNRILASSAAWGMVAWSAYAAIEFIPCGVWPLINQGTAVFTPLTWQLTALLFVAYLVAGAATGGLFGILAARWPVGNVQAARLAGALSLYSAMLVHILTGASLDRLTGTVLVPDVCLFVATVWVILRPSARLARWAVPHPLLAAFLMLGPMWLSVDVIGMGSLRRRLGAVVMVTVTLAVARWLNGFQAWRPSRHLAANLALMGAMIAISVGLSGRNREATIASHAAAAHSGIAPVILFSFDTTRADHLSVYGYGRKTTPHLEEFARTATKFTDMMAASDMTLSSHGSMFTGEYPSWHGAHLYSSEPVIVRPLNPTVPTLAEILAGRGVFTAAAAANSAFLTREWGLARGFQAFDVQSLVMILPPDRSFYLRAGIRTLLSWCFDTRDFDVQYRRAGEVNRDAIGIMEKDAAWKRSFFLLVNYMDSHTPYIAPVPAGFELADGQGAPYLAQYRDLGLGLIRSGRPFPAVARDRLIERYDAGVASEDAAFHQLTSWLKQRGLYDHAMIIVTSDHGEAFGEHGLVGHGVGGYEHQVHVPLLIKYPNQSTASVVTTPVSHVDILPTVLETLGMEIPLNVQGRSLRDPVALEGRPVYSASFPTRPLSAPVQKLNRTERSIRMGSLKLVTSTTGKHELFDLARDPAERHNLMATEPAEGHPLETQLREFVRLIPGNSSKSVQDDAQLRRLRGLGYVN